MSAPSSDGPWLLSIDAATHVCGVALLCGPRMVMERCDESGRAHASTLLSLVDDLLREAELSLEQVEAYAVAIGPGAFTSLRVALSTVKGLAFGSDQPVAAVSTLAARAWAAKPVAGERLAPLLDARRGEVYAGVYRFSGDVLEPEQPEAVDDLGRFLAALGGPCRLVGEGTALVDPAKLAPGVICPPTAEARATPAAVGELGVLALGRGEGVSAVELLPRYLRRAEAEELRLGAARGAGDALATPRKLT